jgi:membrane-bound lytic murein transglycosylase B
MLLARVTVGACLTALPVFLPTAVDPGLGVANAGQQLTLTAAQTKYVRAQTSIMLAAAKTPVRHPVQRQATVAPAEPPATTSPTGIPVAALAAYQQAATRESTVSPGCHLSWQLLAGIGSVESNNAAAGGSANLNWDGVADPPIYGPVLDGQIGKAVPDSDNGKLDGDSSWDRAAGPMQFLPSTWVRVGVDADADGVADPQDIRDAAASAADYLCKGGADMENVQQLSAAVFSYNHAGWYVNDVLTVAASYGTQSLTPGAPGSSLIVSTAIAFAYAHLGDPYRWGGTGPLYDCSGFTQASYDAAGVQIPRTSEEQWLQLPRVAGGQLEPGDLVFFNPGEFRAGLPGHVGIYLGGGYMIDDPHTGATVSIVSIDGFGKYVGAARPALAAAATA